MEQKSSLRILPRAWIRAVLSALEGFAGVFVKAGLGPNAITILSGLAGLAAGFFFWQGRAWAAFAAGALSGVFDILDGKVAARTNRKTAFGAILDSSVDRYSEFFALAGLAAYFFPRWPLWLAMAAFFGGSMVSYTRARAEGLGFACSVGLMQRAERLILLGLAIVIGRLFKIYDPAMIAALGIIAVISNVTAVQRIWHIRRLESGRLMNEGNKP